MRPAHAFGLELVVGLVLAAVFFFVAHGVDGRPEPDLHTLQNALAALLAVFAVLAFARGSARSEASWQVQAALMLLLPLVIAVTQATRVGTLFGVVYAAPVVAMAVLGHGFGALMRTEARPVTSPARRLLAGGGLLAAALLLSWGLTAPQPEGSTVPGVVLAASLLGVVLTTLSPLLPAGLRRRLLLGGLAVPAVAGLLLLALSRDAFLKGQVVALFGGVSFVAACAEARWRRVEAAGDAAEHDEEAAASAPKREEEDADAAAA